MAEKRIIREHPALFLGEERDDLERVYAVDGRNRRVNIKVKDTDEVISETLIAYPNDIEFEIAE